MRVPINYRWNRCLSALISGDVAGSKRDALPNMLKYIFETLWQFEPQASRPWDGTTQLGRGERRIGPFTHNI